MDDRGVSYIFLDQYFILSVYGFRVTKWWRHKTLGHLNNRIKILYYFYFFMNNWYITHRYFWFFLSIWSINFHFTLLYKRKLWSDFKQHLYSDLRIYIQPSISPINLPNQFQPLYDRKYTNRSVKWHGLYNFSVIFSNETANWNLI